METREYKKFILPMAKEYKKPLSLHQEDLCSTPPHGYQAADINFLYSLWAKENSAYFFDIIDFLDAVYLRDQKRIEKYKNEIKNKAKIVTSDLILHTNFAQNRATLYWVEFFTMLKDIWKSSKIKERRIVMPISLAFGKIQHCAVACFSFVPSKKSVEIILLEQHAQKKGTPNYEADVDYTKGVQLHAKIWADIMQKNIGIEHVNTFVNNQPICRRHNVCGVVASELARQLLITNNPMKLVTSGIVITSEEVTQLHARNQLFEASYCKIKGSYFTGSAGVKK